MRSSQGYDASAFPGFRNGIEDEGHPVPPKAHRQRPRPSRQQSFPPPQKATTSIRPQKPEGASSSIIENGKGPAERRRKLPRQRSQEKMSSSKQNQTRKERRVVGQGKPMRRSNSQTKLEKEEGKQQQRRPLRKSKSQTKLGQTQNQPKVETPSTQQQRRPMRRSKSQTKLGQTQNPTTEEPPSTKPQTQRRSLRRTKSQTKLLPTERTQEQASQLKTRRPKLTKAKSGESLPAKPRPKPKRSMSQPSLGDGLSDDAPAEPTRRVEKNSKGKGKPKSANRQLAGQKQQRQGKKLQQNRVESQQVQRQTSQKSKPLSSSNIPDSEAIPVQFNIMLDTAAGHGEKFTIVPGIEMFDEEDEMDDQGLNAERKAQELSSRSSSILEASAPDGSKRDPSTPGALMSPESKAPQSQFTSMSRERVEEVLSRPAKLPPSAPIPNESGRSRSTRRSLSSSGSMGGLTSRILQELDGESMAGAASMSSQQQNWDWLQSTLEQHEEEILRQKKSPPKPPARQKSREEYEPDGQRKSLKNSKPTGTNEVGQDKNKQGAAPSSRRKSVDEERAFTALASQPMQLSHKLSRSSARRLGSDYSISDNTKGTMDDTIAGSECLPESNLAEQVWMENDDSASSSYGRSELDPREDEGSSDNDEEAYVREYVERMQQQRRNEWPQKERIKATKNRTSTNAEANDDEESIDYVADADAHIASKSERVSQMVAAMKRKDLTPSTPVVAKNSILQDRSSMQDYGVTPKATNITAGVGAQYGVTPKATNISSGMKGPQQLKTSQMIEVFQESFTDLHIGIGSSGDSIANSSLSLSITSEDHRRRFLSSTNSQEGSIRSSFNQSLTSITEGLELTGEQLEMLELGSKIQMRSKKKKLLAAQNSSDHSRGQESASGITSDVASELTIENPSLSPTQIEDPPRLPARHISSALDKMKGRGLLDGEGEMQNGLSDSSGAPFGAQARLKAALDLAQKYKAEAANKNPSAANHQVENKLETVHSPASGDSQSSSQSPNIDGETIEKRNEMPDVGTGDEARFVQLDFASPAITPGVQYSDNATVTEEASLDDDLMPRLDDMEQVDAQDILHDGKRRKPSKHNSENGYGSDDGETRNVTGTLFWSKRAESSLHRPQKHHQSKKSFDGGNDTDSRSTASNSVVDRLFRFGGSGTLGHLYDGAELMDESEASMTSHHSL